MSLLPVQAAHPALNSGKWAFLPSGGCENSTRIRLQRHKFREGCSDLELQTFIRVHGKEFRFPAKWRHRRAWVSGSAVALLLDLGFTSVWAVHVATPYMSAKNCSRSGVDGASEHRETTGNVSSRASPVPPLRGRYHVWLEDQMFTFLRNVNVRDAIRAEAPAFVGSLLVAEFFYKFGSFTLECLCFLATWLTLGTVTSFVSRRFDARREIA